MREKKGGVFEFESDRRERGFLSDEKKKKKMKRAIARKGLINVTWSVWRVWKGISREWSRFVNGTKRERKKERIFVSSELGHSVLSLSLY